MTEPDIGNGDAEEAAKIQGGQNKITLTDDHVRQIEAMAGIGLRVEDMATILGIGEATFRRIARRDERVTDRLKKGRTESDQRVVATAYQMATNGKNTAATIFWLKARCGWKETQRLEHTGQDGEGIKVSQGVDLSKLSTDEITAMRDAAAKMKAIQGKAVSGA